VLDRVLRRMTGGRKRGIHWGLKERLEDLHFADDICLLAQRFRDMKEKLRRLQEETKVAELNVSVNKTKEMRVNTAIEDKLNIYDKEVE
jgi:uncharacterized protein YlxW (UPF0749 family)